MRHKFLLIFFIFPLIVLSQKKSICYQIDYQTLEKSKFADKPITIYSCGDKVFLSDNNSKIQYFIDLSQNQYITTLKYKDKVYKHSIPFKDLPKPIIGNKPEKILGFRTKYAKYNYFSNLIEVWFTDKSKAKASLYGRFLPDKNALVLKIRINNGKTIVATKIKKIRKSFDFLPDKAVEISAPELEELKIKSRYTILPIFKDEQINFDPSLKLPHKDSLKTGVTYHLSKGSVVLKKIHIPDSLKQSENVFAKLKIHSNGDAYDRTGTVFIIPETDKKTMLEALLSGSVNELPKFKDKRGFEYQGIKRDVSYEPPIELMRFFTPFGVGHFNDKRKINHYKWQKDALYKAEITDLIPSDKDFFWIGVFIGNYDKGGHKVNLDLEFFPKSDAKTKSPKKFVMPLFSTVNIMEMSEQNYGRLFKTDTLKVDFEIKRNVKNFKLLFTTTGHGGWDTGDEFMPRLNQVFVDGKEVFKVVPWRNDCATYRLANPASGNFSNGMSSSDYSRSNWCPSTLTVPYIIPLKNIKTGKHSIQIVIHQGDDTKNSFSHWNVTGVLVGVYNKPLSN